MIFSVTHIIRRNLCGDNEVANKNTVHDNKPLAGTTMVGNNLEIVMDMEC